MRFSRVFLSFFEVLTDFLRFSRGFLRFVFFLGWFVGLLFGYLMLFLCFGFCSWLLCLAVWLVSSVLVWSLLCCLGFFWLGRFSTLKVS